MRIALQPPPTRIDIPLKNKPIKNQKSGALTNVERFLGLTVGTLSRSIVWSLTQRIERHRVFAGAYPVIAWLMLISDSTQGELSRMIGVEQPTMANTLRRLERDGLIERSPDPNHGRRSRVKLTARGKAISQVMGSAARDLEKVASRGITAAEMNEFFRLAGLMIENLARERRDRKP
jgi:DNA-binding MarR family transcriptional regulator